MGWYHGINTKKNLKNIWCKFCQNNYQQNLYQVLKLFNASIHIDMDFYLNHELGAWNIYEKKYLCFYVQFLPFKFIFYFSRIKIFSWKTFLIYFLMFLELGINIFIFIFKWCRLCFISFNKCQDLLIKILIYW